MPNQDTFTPSEAILLNGFVFAESLDPLHAFPLPLQGEQLFADEKVLAIKMITAAFFANIENGYLSVRQAEHKSILQDDPFMVSFNRQADWPKDTLENNMFLRNKSRNGSEITLYLVFNNIYPRPVYDGLWRDILQVVNTGRSSVVNTGRLCLVKANPVNDRFTKSLENIIQHYISKF